MIRIKTQSWRRFFRGKVRVIGSESFKKVQFRYHRCQVAVRAIYFIIFLFFINSLAFVKDVSELRNRLEPPPIGFWLKWIPVDIAILIIYFIFFASLLGVFLWTGSRLLRLFVFLSFLLSFTIHHSLAPVATSANGWIWITFLLIFLPDDRAWHYKSRVYKMNYITVCWWAMATSLSVYTLSGLWKVLIGLITSLYNREMTLLSPDAMSYQISHYIVRHGYEPPLADFFIQNTWLSWPLFVAVLYMQFFSFWTAFRPLTQGLWLLLIATFHTLNLALMNLPFNYQGFLAIFVLSVFPFSQYPKNAHQILATLPLLGSIYLVCLRLLGYETSPLLK